MLPALLLCPLAGDSTLEGSERSREGHHDVAAVNMFGSRQAVAEVVAVSLPQPVNFLVILSVMPQST